MTAKSEQKLGRFVWEKSVDHFENEAPVAPSRWRTILQRAGLLYVGLLLGASTLLSLAGIDPLFYQGALPKFLLLYVGLATLMALGNSETNLLDEQTRCWLALFRYRPLGGRSEKRQERF